MKIIHLVSGDLWAGAEVQLYHLASNLVKMDPVSLIVIVFNNGSKIQIASSAALVQADVDVVFGAIKNAQESRWHKVLVEIGRAHV